ncbi:RagB/SusD family nutrient uptake outer membrane protein [Mucilaginibacter sp. S1162]|uniref:RagB/SusD family nutrient uptake outer membrane protein n=1 Tax=Mucilaginibacter humi TaxID=2732510 RepID=A0ABX1W1D3_9SPHI|nr:RagB/SusD family nutrient uptake outer membrane protein [Mucilaginibacter humi]
MAGEALRKNDLIRWGIFVPTIKALLSDITDTAAPAETNRGTASGSAYFAVLNLNKITDRDLLWPYPTSELQYNKALKQNEGW